jgi:hypothetical protein
LGLVQVGEAAVRDDSDAEGGAVSRHMPEHDPGSRFEDEGTPDLQDGTPQQQWAVDPQEAPLPGDRPVAAEAFGTTPGEQIEGEPLDGRLAREEPEEQAVLGTAGPPVVRDQPPAGEVGLAEDRVTADSGLGPGSDLSTGFEPGPGTDPGWPAQPEEPSGQVWDDLRPAGRLVAPDQGTSTGEEPDEVASEVGPDGGGFTAEESAIRVEPG